MNSKRVNLLLIVAISLLCVGLLGGVYGMNKLLTAEADKLLALKAKSAALQQQRINLVKAKKDIAAYSGLKKVTQTIVPEDKSQAQAVREIVNIAANNGITLAAITFPASTLGSGVTVGVPAPAAAAPAPAAGGAASKKAGNLSQLLPVKNIAGVYQLPITVTSDTHRPVAYSKLISFLDALEHNRRTAQVSNISIIPDTNNRNLVSFTLILNEYIKP